MTIHVKQYLRPTYINNRLYAFYIRTRTPPLEIHYPDCVRQNFSTLLSTSKLEACYHCQHNMRQTL